MKRLFSIMATLAMLGSILGLTPTSVHATEITPSAGDLIKGSFSTVYYYASDGNRYNFPNEKTYFTWYSDFSTVQTVSDTTLASMRLVGNVTYRPGVRMVKLVTVPKVYAVECGSILRWVTTEALASNLYGTAWNTKIDDLPDTFYPHYTISADITDASQFDPTGQEDATPTIDTNLGFTDPVGTTPTAPTLTDPGSSIASGTTFNIAWSSISGATRYTLQRDDSPSFSDPTNIYSGTNITTTDYLVPGSTTTYYYRVNASNGVGTSGWSNTGDITVSTTGVPTAPILTDPGSSVSSGASFTLSFTGVSGVTTYVLEQSTDSAFTSSTTIYSGLSTSYTHSISPSSTTTYYWRVQGRNAVGHGAWSNTVDLTINGTTPVITTPSAPVMTDPGTYVLDGTSYNVSWSSATDVTYYCFEWDIDEDFSDATGWCSSGIALSTAGQTSTPLLTTYYYRVKACNSAGCSGWSNTVDMVVSDRDVVFASDFGGNITNALAGAVAGETVYVASGTSHSGPITIPSEVSLIGEGAEYVTLDGAGLPYTVTMGTGTTLVGFTIKNATTALVYCVNGSGSSIINNILNAEPVGATTPTGIYLSNATGIFIGNNTIYDSSGGLFSASGIYADPNPSNNFIAFNNVIQGFMYGIQTVLPIAGISEYNLIFSPLHPVTGWVTILPGIGDLPLPASFINNYSNLRLVPGSAGIDAGNPDIALNDLDGTRNDMGVFGGPHARR